MMHIVTLPLVHHSAELADRRAHHSEASYDHGAHTASTHRKLTTVTRSNNPAAGLERIRKHDMRTPHPRRNSMTSNLNIRAENIAERAAPVLKEHDTVVLSATDL